MKVGQMHPSRDNCTKMIRPPQKFLRLTRITVYSSGAQGINLPGYRRALEKFRYHTCNSMLKEEHTYRTGTKATAPNTLSRILLSYFTPTATAPNILIHNTKFFVLFKSSSIVLNRNWTLLQPPIVYYFPGPQAGSTKMIFYT